MINILVYLIVISFVFYIDIKISKNKKERVYNSISKNFNVYKLVGYSLVIAFLTLFLSHLLIYIGILEDITKIDLSLMLIISNLSTIFFTPIVEEYFFRYLPIKIIKNKDYHLGIMLITSIIFTLIHKASGAEYLLVFLSSILLSFAYLKNDNILYSIVPHSLYNFLVILSSCFIDKVNIAILVIEIFIIFIGLLLIKKRNTLFW